MPILTSYMKTLGPWSKPLAVIATLIAIAPAFVWASAVSALPSPEALVERAGGSLQIHDRNGELLFEFAGAMGGFRSPVPLSQISGHVIDATVATEDADFWKNNGLNTRGLLRALYENLSPWERGGFLRGSGGSSITQQLVRNLYMSPGERGGRDLLRKAKEAVLAVHVTRQYSKEDTLEWYLNTVFYGNAAYGIEAAAHRYFGKSASDLSVGEAALLAGLPNAPALYDPLKDPTAAKQRQEQVLALMVRHGYLSERQAREAREGPLSLNSDQFPIRAPHFVFYVHQQLGRLLGDVPRGNLHVVTTLDAGLQSKAEDILRGYLATLEAQFGARNGSVVVTDPRSGEVLAMVGSRDYFDDSLDGQVNNALALNQPGSTMKPFTYLAAFLKGWSPATIIADAPISISDGRAAFVLRNADGRYRGSVSARTALGNSLNVPAVKALEFAGLDDVYNLAQRLGITTLKDRRTYGPAFTLGGADVNLLDLTYAYAVLANQGEQVGHRPNDGRPAGYRPLDPVAVLRVEDASGKVLYEHETQRERIAPAAETYLVTDILADDQARSQMFGLNSALRLADRPAAVKTGLSDEARDAWAVGYASHVAVGVWVGNTDNSPMPGALSSRTAAPIWNAVMQAALEGLDTQAFPMPEGVIFVRICAATGKLPTAKCSQVVTEVFVVGQEPSEGALVSQEQQTEGPAPTRGKQTSGSGGRKGGGRGRD